MNLSFKIELVAEGNKASLYTIKIGNSMESEFEKFLSNGEVKSHQEFQPLILRLQEIIDKYGCQERFFKLNESKYHDTVVALWRGNLRLYCCRYGNIILLLGSGGIKKTRTYQEDEHLNNIVTTMTEVSDRIDRRILEDKTLKIIGNKLVGNLEFK